MTIDRHIAASIDLGSNTFRLLVAACSTGSTKTLDKKLATVGLGQGLKENRIIAQESMEKGLAVLRNFRASLENHKPQSIRVCGTEALRQAENSDFFLNRAEEILQCRVEIISGEEEARLGLAGTLSGNLVTEQEPFLLVDVGGGSTELIFSSGPLAKPLAESLDLGVVGLTERFLGGPAPETPALDSLLSEVVRRTLHSFPFPEKSNEIKLIGSGGTATSMAAMDLNLTTYDASLVHGHVIDRASIEKLWDDLIAIPAGKRNELPCLGDGRGEILPAGIRIYLIILQLLQVETMQVSDSGLLEGIMISSLPSAFRTAGEHSLL